MNKNSFKFATKKQYDLAESVKERIINDIKYMNNLNELNQVANTNFDKEELQYFFKEKNDFKYFINQNNISTNSIIVSAMMKLKRN
ncbi:hypothetical protein QI045_12220 [Staphylococcus saprophyticus]|uniref:hypothetical protein n=1 Tax=Staphylococcus saprophyticus TaxID=29385 RepID=UPI000FF878F5|nr:hypothetical protein [Staphylococcus saprophyticus]CAC6886820.1 Uncharacterised protein [Staphylococcus aureus]MDW4404284.1 hypothetical protein [Staphylococcus saprophyticus]RWZ79102.1 hypothetical protein EPJ51_12520 [Staphylococcus saprophyticus]CAC7531618.1 Uncharacterised protein [Staphylococcus aureus]CAC7549620.1 Uncharacterised protein [Staphylococcus aureus]